MANNVAKNVSTIVLKQFLMGFEDDTVLLNTVDKQRMSGAINPSTGDSIQFKRPHQYSASRTSGGDQTGVSNNIISATATGTVSDFITVNIDWTLLEEAIELNQLEEILAPARAEMVTTYENELANFMQLNAGLVSGDADEAIDAWGDVASCGSYLKSLGATGETYASMNPFSVQDLADAQGGLSSGDSSLVTTAWKDAQISRNFGGLRGIMCNSLESYTSGTATGAGTLNSTPTVTYSALKDTYQITVDLAGFTGTDTLVAGQQIQFDDTFMLNQQNKNTISKRGSGIPFVGTVLEDATAAAGSFTGVKLSGAPIFDATNPQYNTVDRAITSADAITVLGSAETVYQAGLFYTKGFVGTGTVELPKLAGWDSSVVNYKGYSIRATKYSDPITNVQSCRFDMLPTFCVFNPMMGGQFFGNP